jgi:hypothetical protein
MVRRRRGGDLQWRRSRLSLEKACQLLVRLAQFPRQALPQCPLNSGRQAVVEIRLGGEVLDIEDQKFDVGFSHGVGTMTPAIDVSHITNQVAGKNMSEGQGPELGGVLDSKSSLEHQDQLRRRVAFVQGQSPGLEIPDGPDGSHLNPLRLVEMREDPKTAEKLGYTQIVAILRLCSEQL